ncbi:MAG: sugar phosphate nucleotidyltransferase, partial [Romboutsia timonensis]
MQALILAAGKGSRLGSLTENRPKCMLDIAGKSIIDRTVESLINNNIYFFD